MFTLIELNDIHMKSKIKSKMKRGILMILCIALLTGVTSGRVLAQTSINARATAEVIQALTAREAADLNFGRFSPETAGGEVKLTPNGVISSTGTVALSGGIHNAASFYLTGQNNSTVSISLPSGPAVLTNAVSAKTMEVYNWESYPSAGLGVGILNNGSLSVTVGATLKVGNMTDNPTGIYTGTYAITFAYN
jgi:hypothetical protein